MPMPLQDIEAEALQLPLEERGRLARRCRNVLPKALGLQLRALSTH